MARTNFVLLGAFGLLLGAALSALLRLDRFSYALTYGGTWGAFAALYMVLGYAVGGAKVSLATAVMAFALAAPRFF